MLWRNGALQQELHLCMAQTQRCLAIPRWAQQFWLRLWAVPVYQRSVCTCLVVLTWASGTRPVCNYPCTERYLLIYRILRIVVKNFIHDRRNIEARSRNHYCCGKEMCIVYCWRMFVALRNQHAMRVRHIFICGLPRSKMCFHFVS